jgi:transcription elongation factor Elf1
MQGKDSQMKGYFKGELRPCPFCGDSVEVEDVGGYEICCSNCGLLMWEITKKDLSETWNNRPAFDKAIDALCKVMDWCDKQYRNANFDGLSAYAEDAVKKSCGLTKAEALEIYHERQEKTK